jgi:hypothetical protein
MRVELEAALMYSRIGQSSLVAGVEVRDAVESLQYGLALESDIGAPEDSLHGGLDLGWPAATRRRARREPAGGRRRPAAGRPRRPQADPPGTTASTTSASTPTTASTASCGARSSARSPTPSTSARTSTGASRSWAPGS